MTPMSEVRVMTTKANPSTSLTANLLVAKEKLPPDCARAGVMAASHRTTHQARKDAATAAARRICAKNIRTFRIKTSFRERSGSDRSNNPFGLPAADFDGRLVPDHSIRAIHF